MSSSATNINMKTFGDQGISIQNYGHIDINLTIYNDGENEVRSKRKRKLSERQGTPDAEETMRGKRSK